MQAKRAESTNGEQAQRASYRPFPDDLPAWIPPRRFTPRIYKKKAPVSPTKEIKLKGPTVAQPA